MLCFRICVLVKVWVAVAERFQMFLANPSTEYKEWASIPFPGPRERPPQSNHVREEIVYRISLRNTVVCRWHSTESVY
jgi:hypothetical protein